MTGHSARHSTSKIPPNSHPFILLIRNTWIARTPVGDALVQLAKCISAERKLRHLHVHGGVVPDLADLTNSNLYDILKFFTLTDLAGQVVAPPHLVNSGFRLEAKAIDSKLLTIVVQVEAATSRLFESLFPVYDGIQKALHAQPHSDCARALTSQNPDG